MSLYSLREHLQLPINWVAELALYTSPRIQLSAYLAAVPPLTIFQSALRPITRPSSSYINVFTCKHLPTSPLCSLTHSTRNSSPLAEPRALNEAAISKRSFAFSAPRLYDRLPLSVRSCLSLYSSFLHFSISYDPSYHAIIPIYLP